MKPERILIVSRASGKTTMDAETVLKIAEVASATAIAAVCARIINPIKIRNLEADG